LSLPKKTFSGGRTGAERAGPILTIVTILFVIVACEPCAIADEREAVDIPAGKVEDVMRLPSVNVQANRIEEFGFRTSGMIAIPGPSYFLVSEVLPNTAAAKAGLRPGELIEGFDGRKLSVLSLALRFKKTQDRKMAELAAGKTGVTWSLEVRAPGATQTQTVTMVLPSPPPHWGAAKWSAPAGRSPILVTEPGPLAGRAAQVMENGIWAVLPFGMRLMGVPPVHVSPLTGYEWRIVQPSGSHRIWVTQARGKTEILLDYSSREFGAGVFVTSPSGALEKALCRGPARKGEVASELPWEDVRARFQAEVGFWLTGVGRVTGRWPFEALSGGAEDIAMSAKADQGAPGPLSSGFLRLPLADAAQKALFSDALGKVGLDDDQWAYTETSQEFDDKHVTTVRMDPSKPPSERCTLLKVDGKAPGAAYIRRWRLEAPGATAILGELPSISSIVDVDAVRVFADENTAIVFELPVKGPSGKFSADKFQALFRVNKTQRAFEDFSVKLRDALRVGGVIKVTDAGMEVRFQTFDPTSVPQPVLLSAGAGARVMLVKFSRRFQVTRTDFTRVNPFDGGVSAQKEPPPPVPAPIPGN